MTGSSSGRAMMVAAMAEGGANGRSGGNQGRGQWPRWDGAWPKICAQGGRPKNWPYARPSEKR